MQLKRIKLYRNVSALSLTYFISINVLSSRLKRSKTCRFVIVCSISERVHHKLKLVEYSANDEIQLNREKGAVYKVEFLVICFSEPFKVAILLKVIRRSINLPLLNVNLCSIYPLKWMCNVMQKKQKNLSFIRNKYLLNSAQTFQALYNQATIPKIRNFFTAESTRQTQLIMNFL